MGREFERSARTARRDRTDGRNRRSVNCYRTDRPHWTDRRYGSNWRDFDCDGAYRCHRCYRCNGRSIHSYRPNWSYRSNRGNIHGYRAYWRNGSAIYRYWTDGGYWCDWVFCDRAYGATRSNRSGRGCRLLGFIL